MTLLRSREIPQITPKSSPKSLKNGLPIEPLTPAKAAEGSNMSSYTPTNHFGQSPDHLKLGLGSDSSVLSGTGTTVRRSSRLASKSISGEVVGNVVSGRKRKIITSDNGTNHSNELEVLGGFVEMDAGLDTSVSDLSKTVSAKKVCGNGNFGADVEVSGSGEGDREMVCVNLRSGKKILKEGVNGNVGIGDFGVECGHGDKLVDEDDKEGKEGEGAAVLNTCAVWGSLDMKEMGNGTGPEESCRWGRRRSRRLEKGKGKAVEVDISSTNSNVDFKELKSEVKVEKTAEKTDSGDCLLEEMETDRRAGSSKRRFSRAGSSKRRFSREEKGKGKAVEVGLSSNHDAKMESDLEQKLETSIESKVPGARSPVGDVAVQDGRQVTGISGRANTTRTSRFRDIARKNASRFAHFPSQEEDVNQVVDEAEGEVLLREMNEEIEDWPGPFSTAMKIIRDRETNSMAQQSSCLDKSDPIPVKWMPRTDQHNRLKLVAPSLRDLCMTFLAKNADAITSLDSVPDVLRHKLSQVLCDSRRMNAHFVDLLVSGSPTEIRVKDCSWLSEEQFTKTFDGCDITKLTVLQLDQCGRCLPDYTLFATLARSPNHLSALTTISLKGACRLSDSGLKALVSSAPMLRSINLSQCSLLTADAVDSLAETLGSVLMELYLDDCESIDPILILPALTKLKHLEVLSLAGIQTVCDDFIIQFVAACGQNLKEFSLANCMKLTDSTLKAIAETCSDLCAIDLTNLRKLTDYALGYLANGCQAIQTLKLCHNAFSDEAVAAYLETCGESLRALSLNNVKVAHNTAISLAKRSRNLLSLDLSWCRKLRNEALGLIVDSCLSLKVLKLFGCTQITDVFIDGHSNPQVQVIGLKFSPILKHIEVPELVGPLHYSSA